MSTIAVKRIMRDYKSYQESDLSDTGIHCLMNEDDIYNMTALIIGPKDTPYEGGFYFFNIRFPSNYPFKYPHVKFMTLNSAVRFNPNYYKCGKVCLSILGTWSGPGWTSVMNLSSVLLTLQSRLNEMPFRNEPGYETDNSHLSLNYNKVLRYYNITVAVIQMIRDTPCGFDIFKSIMNQEFIKNCPYYIKYIRDNIQNKGTTIKSSAFGMSVTINTEYLEKMIKDIYNTINPKIAEKLEAEKSEAGKSEAVITKKTPYVRKSPNDLAENYDLGIIKVSENNGKKYIVALRVNGTKFWKKYKESKTPMSSNST